MKTFAKIVLAAAVGISVVSTAMAASTIRETALAAPFTPKPKNWTAPAGKIYAQQLSDELMKKYPELVSITFHGVPPGMSKVYTMFAGSYPDRIGQPDDPDDVDVIVKGITILDPRFGKDKDAVKKFVMMMPLRDAKGTNIGLLVAAFANEKHWNDIKVEREYFKKGMDLRDALQKQIPSYEALYAPAK